MHTDCTFTKKETQNRVQRELPYKFCETFQKFFSSITAFVRLSFINYRLTAVPLHQPNLYGKSWYLSNTSLILFKSRKQHKLLHYKQVTENVYWEYDSKSETLNNHLYTVIGLHTENKNPANIYLFKVNNRNTRKRCEMCSKLPIKTPGRRQWHRSGVSIVNFEHISHLFSSVSIVDFEQVNVSWESFLRNFHNLDIHHNKYF